MSRSVRFRLSLLLILVVLIAGCLGGTNSTATPDPPDTEWTTEDGLNTTALAYHHVETLRGAGSFTVNHSETIRVDGDAQPDGPTPEAYTPPSSARQQVALDDGRYLGTFVTVAHRRSTHFITPEVTATRRKSCPDCDYDYDYQERPEGDMRAERLDRYRTDEPANNLARFLQGVTVGFNYSYTGTVQRDGETLYRYRAEQNLSTAPPPFAEPPRGMATILLTEDGVIRQFELQYAGPATVTRNGEKQTVPVTHTFVRTYTEVGETTIERPPWVDRAMDEDSSRETETGDR